MTTQREQTPFTRPPEQELMPGLRIIHEGLSRYAMVADSVDILRTAFGEDALVGLARVFAASDRLSSVMDLMGLNWGTTGPGQEDSVRFERNFFTLGLFSTGLVFELQVGIRYLDKETKFRGMLTTQDRQKWATLLEAALVDHGDIIEAIRNELAFHIGKDKTVRRGLEAISAEKTVLRVQTSDGPHNVNNRREFGFQAILAGIMIPDESQPADANGDRPERQLQTSDVTKAFTAVSAAHFAIVKLVDEVFIDALVKAGATLRA
jgi:hypothetical protein